MTMPFYVSPEQLMKDRADFARKGIGRGRGVVAVQYGEGIVLVSENPRSLHKISEIYDRVAFAAVGRYNEFENLRIAGVRLADMRGYAYDRRDVTGRGLANAYAQTLGTIFSSGGEKPYEVEIFVAEVGDLARSDELYRITYDGQMVDEHGFAAMGGDAESVVDLPPRALDRGRLAGRRAEPRGGRARPRRRRRPADPGPRPRGGGARPHPHPAPQVPAADRARPARRARPRRRVRVRRRSADDDTSVAGGGEASHQPQVPDDPADPTDTASSVPRWRTRSPASRRLTATPQRRTTRPTTRRSHHRSTATTRRADGAHLRQRRPGRPRRAPRLRAAAAPGHADHAPQGRHPAGLAGHGRRRRGGPDRGLDLPRPRQGRQPAP